MSRIQVDESKLLSTLKELIAIESVNPSLVQGGNGEYKIAEHIGERLEKAGLEVNYQRLGGNRQNVVAVMKGGGSGGRTLMLNGHTDTVGTAGMETPLLATYRDGKVYGRGAFDMKGGLAAMICAAESLKDKKTVLRGDLVLAFVADEEYASIGTEELVKEYAANAAIVTEPTNLDVIIAHRGFAWASVDVSGRAAHGSRYDIGVDAIAKAGKFLVALEKMDIGFNALEPHPLLGRPSVHASLISGGTELSTYPEHCRIELERRTLPSESEQTVRDELGNLLEEISETDSDFHAESKVFLYRSALEVPRNLELVRILSQETRRVLGKEPHLVGAGWWTDAALLNDVGIPTVLFGHSGEGAHASVEYADFNSLVQMTEVLVRTTVSFCS
jgi:acetylornithine deacetylase